MIIAVDFDGTIAERGEGMEIVSEVPGAIEALRELRKRHTLILWTCRGGEWLDAAVAWLKERGIHFDAVNENIHVLGDGYYPRKVFAHVYVDDSIIGGFPGWKAVRQQLLKT